MNKLSISLDEGEGSKDRRYQDLGDTGLKLTI